MCYKLLENPGFVREKTARDVSLEVFLIGTITAPSTAVVARSIAPPRQQKSRVG